MKKIIDLIKKLLGGGSIAEKAVELQQLETEVVAEVKVVEAKIAEIYKKKGVDRPSYQGDLPEGNNGLGILSISNQPQAWFSSFNSHPYSSLQYPI